MVLLPSGFWDDGFYMRRKKESLQDDSVRSGADGFANAALPGRSSDKENDRRKRQQGEGECASLSILGAYSGQMGHCFWMERNSITDTVYL